MTTPSPTTWRMHAHRCQKHPNVGPGVFYQNFGQRRWVELHGLPKPIVEVELILDPDGDYWGWIKTGESEPTMIQPHQSLFNCQFPYGPTAEQERGKGTIVRLSVTELPPASA